MNHEYRKKKLFAVVAHLEQQIAEVKSLSVGVPDDEELRAALKVLAELR